MSLVVILSEPRLRREAWRALLQAQPGIKVVACVGETSGLADLEAPEQGVAMLVDMEDLLVETLRLTARLRPAWGALVLVRTYDHHEIAPLLRAGAMGVLTRDSSVAEFVSALVSSARGELVLPGSLTPELLTDLLGRALSSTDDIPALSPREEEVLRLLAHGLTNKAIAQDLLLSVRTVESHLRAIYAKLQVASRTEAVLWAVAHMNPPPG